MWCWVGEGFNFRCFILLVRDVTLLNAAFFFTTPTAPTTITKTHYYNTLPLNISVTSPYNTRYNSNWVLQCGDVHPNLGHRRIYQRSAGTFVSFRDHPSPSST